MTNEHFAFLRLIKKITSEYTRDSAIVPMVTLYTIHLTTHSEAIMNDSDGKAYSVSYNSES
jgi:hypothetical protein